MREAVIEGMELGAPTVGRWRPAVGLGAPLRPGLLLGSLEQAGLDVPVHAPDGAGGVVVSRCAPGTWVAFGERLLTMGEGGGAVAEVVPGPARAPDLPDDATPIVAETDGTVYLRPAPDKPLFATEGAAIAAQATIALVEVMKTFTPVRAPVAGELVRVCVSDGDPIEAGAVLCWIRPGGA